MTSSAIERYIDQISFLQLFAVQCSSLYQSWPADYRKKKLESGGVSKKAVAIIRATKKATEMITSNKSTSLELLLLP
jgi:hypothetical protein